LDKHRTETKISLYNPVKEGLPHLTTQPLEDLKISLQSLASAPVMPLGKAIAALSTFALVDRSIVLLPLVGSLGARAPVVTSLKAVATGFTGHFAYLVSAFKVNLNTEAGSTRG
jgi:hypothetical protein